MGWGDCCCWRWYPTPCLLSAGRTRLKIDKRFFVFLLTPTDCDSWLDKSNRSFARRKIEVNNTVKWYMKKTSPDKKPSVLIIHLNGFSSSKTIKRMKNYFQDRIFCEFLVATIKIPAIVEAEFVSHSIIGLMWRMLIMFVRKKNVEYVF